MDYAIVHQGKAFTPNQTQLAADQASAHNAEVERQELSRWNSKPDTFAVYVTSTSEVRGVTTNDMTNPPKELQATNWTGKVLGTIYYRHTFRGNIARNITAIRFRGTNGASYYGRFGSDWSQLCRVRKMK